MAVATDITGASKEASVLDLAEILGEGLAEVRRESLEQADKNLLKMGHTVADLMAGLIAEFKTLFDQQETKYLGLAGDVRSVDSYFQKSFVQLQSQLGDVSVVAKMLTDMMKRVEERLEKQELAFEARFAGLEAKVNLITRSEKIDKEIEYVGGLPVRIHEHRKFGE